MIRRDYHLHTSFCDGKNSPRDMVEAAIALGMTAIGFSVHSYTFFDESYCIKKERMAAYIAEIHRLKEEFSEKITILCGAERDYYAKEPEGALDYTIGSLHYVKKGGVYYPVDESAEALKSAIAVAWGGDPYAFAEDYFEAYSQLGKRKPQILGHFDLLTKFNEKEPLFDETHPRYLAAATKALDALLPLGIPFEINTGAISRGYRTSPYPAEAFLRYIAEQGGKVILSSDAHTKEGLCYQFDTWEALAKSLGVTVVEEI